MYELSEEIAVQVIFLVREGATGDRELRAFIDGLNEDDKAQLTALAWVGRGTFDATDFDRALETAYEEATVPTADYLTGMPHLAENLEAGLDAMGIDVTRAEEDLL